MNILINLASTEKDGENPFHGGNEYSVSVSKELLNCISKRFNRNLFFYCNSLMNIDKTLVDQIASTPNAEILVKSKTKNLDCFLRQYNISRLYDPLGTSVLSKLYLDSIEVVSTLHGLRGLEMPTDISEYFIHSRFKYLLKIVFGKLYKRHVRIDFEKALKFKCSRKTLIVVSNHSKYAILNNFGAIFDNIKVFYSPSKITSSINYEKEVEVLSKYYSIVSKKYFLVISTKRWIKNAYRVVKAFDEMIDNGHIINMKIVMIGASSSLKKLIKNKEYFIPLNYIESDELEVFYKNAYVFIYPSLNEGFGYAPLEAMKYSTPVIASMISSIPEIVGSAAIGFNPFLIDELKNRILQLLHDKELYARLKVEARKRFEFISDRQSKDLKDLVNLILE